ncbi:energy transducer TonB [Hydrogenophaga sp. RWCD_12]|uniref:energy transducer TonB n=1 Tax=Hydrogenophaga sp. RWCD_12 TaxID=3391190 RepID=UPI0039851BAF
MPFTQARFATALVTLTLLGACALPQGGTAYRVGNNPAFLSSQDAQRELIRETLEHQVKPPLDKPLQLLNAALPEYPIKALQQGVEGSVTLRFDVLADGSVSHVTVVESPNDDLSAAARDAVAQWKFSPVSRNGAGVTLKFAFTYRFELNVTPSR